MSYLDILLKKEIINHYQLDEAQEKAVTMNNDLDAALASMHIDAGIIAEAKSEFFGVPVKQLGENPVPISVMKYIPIDAAKNYHIVPMGLFDGVLDVGVLDPGSTSVKNALQFIASQAKIPFEVFIVSYDDYRKIIGAYGGFSSASHDMDEVSEAGIEQGSIGQQDDVLNIDEDDTTTLSKNSSPDTLVEDAPATKMIGVMVRNAVDGGASDIHIEHAGSEVKIRFRVDGILYTSLHVAPSMHSALVAKVKSLANLRLDEKRKPQDGRFMATVNDRKIDFRVSTFPTFFGEKVVIRILDSGKGIKKLDELGMTAEHSDMIRTAISKPYGMILITGPTGAGKSTTLYSMVNELDREKLNVVSLEDPVEYNIPGMNQSQVRPEIGYTFATGLRSILRQDPDVIMVEIRDKETAELAVNAALTGHLVLATLHTNTAIGAIPRLIDMGVDPYLIAPTLIMSIAQRMIRTLSPGKGKKIPIEGVYVDTIRKEFSDLSPERLATIPLSETLSDVSDNHADPGTHGRIACFEMFTVDKGLQDLIIKDPTDNTLTEYLKKNQGMLSMRQDAVVKCMQGVVPWVEVNTL